MLLAIDTETTGIDFFHGCKPFMITACDGRFNYIWEGQVNPATREVYWDDEEIDSFVSLIKSASRIIMHNANFDIRALSTIGIPPSYFWDKLEDTLLASHCICSGDVHGLKDLAFKYFGYSDEDEHTLAAIVKERVREGRKRGYRVAAHGDSNFPGISKNGTEFWKMDYWLAPDACRNYASRDVERTLLLWDAFKPSLIADNLWEPYQTRKKLLRIAYDMQSAGKNFYTEKAAVLIDQFTQEMEQARQTMKQVAGITYRFDPNKPAHLTDMIHHRLRIPVDKYTGGKKSASVDDVNTGRPAMDKKTIEFYTKNYASPALEALSRYKRKPKQRRDIEAYLNWIDENNRIHPFLNITGTRETRQSSSNPNDQNIDKALKPLFGPPPGKVWICTDMVNIELRIWAYAVGNRELVDLFEAGHSVHELIMNTIFPDLISTYRIAKQLSRSSHTDDHRRALAAYQRVKNGNFSRIYGATDAKTNETYHGAKNPPINYCALIDKRFPGIKEFMQTRTLLAQRVYSTYNVFAIHTLGGYRLDVPCDEPFKACNYYVQGSAGWLMTLAMIEWYNHPDYRRYNCSMISQIHDGLDTEAPLSPALPRIIDAKCLCISRAGRTLIPTCDVTWELLYHPSDETDSTIQDVLQGR